MGRRRRRERRGRRERRRRREGEGEGGREGGSNIRYEHEWKNKHGDYIHLAKGRMYVKEELSLNVPTSMFAKVSFIPATHTGWRRRRRRGKSISLGT